MNTPSLKVVRWFGGKTHLLPLLLERLPAHTSYVEVLGGGAALLLAKPPSSIETYNDKDETLVNFFRVVRETKLRKALREQLQYTPYSRAEFIRLRHWCRQGEPIDQFPYDPESPLTLDEQIAVERARRFFVLMQQSFNAIYGSSWRYAHSDPKTVVNYWRTLDRIEQLALRLQRVQLENDSFEHIIPRYDHPDCCMYLDPPYIPETRTHPDIYRHEMTLEQHKQLVDMILNCKSMVILSGYDHPIYAPLERHGWLKETFNVECKVSPTFRDPTRQRTRRNESIWRNPACLKKSHHQLTLVSLD